MPLLQHYLPVGASTSFAVSYLTALTWSSGSTITGSVDIGTLDTGKEIFLVSHSEGSAIRTLTAASTTVGSVAVTKSSNTEAGPSSERAIAWVQVPTKAGSQTITVTYSGTLTAGVVAVYKVLSRPHIGTADTDSDNAAAIASWVTLSATTINANGIWFGAHVHTNTDATTSPGTEDYDAATGANRIAFSHRSPQALASTPSDTWSWTSSTLYRTISWAFD